MNQYELNNIIIKYFNEVGNKKIKYNDVHTYPIISDIILKINKVSDKLNFLDDMTFIRNFDNEISDIIKIDEENGKLKYFKNYSYKLINNEKPDKKKQQLTADKYYIDNILDKYKMRKLEDIMSLYFESNFKIEESRSLLSKQFKRWNYEAHIKYIYHEDFIFLLNLLV